jgi:hypothetical protein
MSPREVVGEVLVSWFPDHVELALANSLSDPVEAHVSCLRATLRDNVVGNSCGYGVVGDDGSGLCLQMSKVCGGVSQWGGCLAVLEQAAVFSFRSSADYGRYHFAVGQEPPLTRSEVEESEVEESEVEESACLRPCVGLGVEGGGLGVQYHWRGTLTPPLAKWRRSGGVALQQRLRLRWGDSGGLPPL